VVVASSLGRRGWGYEAAFNIDLEQAIVENGAVAFVLASAFQESSTFFLERGGESR